MRRLHLPLALLLSVPALAQTGGARAPEAMAAPSAAAARETPPPPGPPREFKVPASRKFTLENGLEVRLVEYGAVPKVFLSLDVYSGNIDEAEGEEWLSGLTGDLLGEGTTTRTAARISEEAASMGGSVEVQVSPDDTRISGEVLSASAEAMTRLLADVARNPKFEDAAVTRKRNDRLRELSVRRSEPQSLADEKYLAAIYPGHPYGRLFPTAASLKGLTAGRVRAFYEQNYGAARAHFVAAGRFDAAAVEKAIRESFGDWKKGSAPKAIPASAHLGRSLQLVDRPGAVQSTLVVGLPVIDMTSPDWIAQTVTNAILGGSFGSRITSNIREKKGYTYSPRSRLQTHRHDANWAEIADVTTKDTGASLKEIFYEIDRLAKEAPGADELKGIQNYLAGIFVVQNSSRAGIALQLQQIDLQGLGEDYLSTYVQKVHAVTPQDVQRLSSQRLKPGGMTVVVVGDLATVRSQVASYAEPR